MFRVDLVSSIVPLLIIFIRWCLSVIFSALDECNLIELQLIMDELIEHVSGRMISAKELKVQFSWIVVPLWGQVSVKTIWPLKVKLYFLYNRFPDWEEELLIAFETEHVLPIICD